MTLEGLAAALADRYTIERELGGGGMSRVYLAQETALGRSVVIKVIAPELAEGLSAERFTREVKLAARLQQANIVPVLTAGEAGGLPYYTMPYVKGETLRARLNAGLPSTGPSGPANDVLSILRDVARALSYAHAEGVVHRDIKPENILLSGGAAVVTDFGIARAISASRTQERATPADRLTQTGSSIGTPAYMAPEQAVGGEVDHRADLYAFGVVAYESLAGAHPFASRTGAQQLIAAHIAEIPAPLSARVPSLPRSVSDLVMQCLEKDPARRPASAELLVAGLSNSVTQTSGELASTAGDGNRWRIVAGAVALIAVAAFAYIWKGRMGGSNGDGQRIIAILPFRNISQDTAQQYFSAGMTEEITSQLGKVAALRVLGRSATAQYDTSPDRLERMGRELGVGSVVDGSIRLAGDRVRINVELTDVRTGQSLWSEQYDRELADLFALQDDVARKVASALQARLSPAEATRLAHAPTTSTGAYQIYLRARTLPPTRRTDNVTQAELLKQAIELDSGFALAHAYLGRNYMFRAKSASDGWIDSGFVEARKAIALDPDLSDGHFVLGDLLSQRLKYSAAEAAYLKAIELNPSATGALADLGNAYGYLGKYDKALDVALRSAQLDPAHRHAPYHVGYSLIQLDDDSATARYLLEAERKRPDEPRVQGLLAWLAFRRGDNAGALARLRRIAAQDPDNTELPPMLAEHAMLSGAPDAEQLLKQLVDADPETASQYDAAGFRSFYALALFRRGEQQQARELWSQSKAASEAQIRNGAEGPGAAMELAAISAVQGRTAEAMDWLEKGYASGWRDARQLELDPFFEPVRQEPRYIAVLIGMREDVALMRQRAAAAHPELFNPVPK